MIALSVADLVSGINLHRAGRSSRGTCPACSYAAAFSLRPGKGDRINLFCANCDDEDAITQGVSWPGVGAWTPPNAAALADDPAAARRRQEAATRLRDASVPAFGTIADAYLTSPSLFGVATSLALRFRGDCYHPERCRLPAIIATGALLNARPRPVPFLAILATDGAHPTREAA
jgi:hypothetical protein